MKSEKTDYRELLKGNIPPWIFRFIKSCGRSINKFDMIREGEKVIVAVSGGKDSVVLSLALALRLKWLPINYSLEAVLINWNEEPIEDEKLEILKNFYDDLNVNLRIIDEDKYPHSFKGDFNCYLCSRNRRRILFTLAEKEDVHLIATGHHLDDIVETTIMNLAFRAKFESMYPVQSFFEGKINIIRPLCEIKESIIERITNEYNLPIVKSTCPYNFENVRYALKPIIKELSQIDKLTREHIFTSLDFNCRPVRKE